MFGFQRFSAIAIIKFLVLWGLLGLRCLLRRGATNRCSSSPPRGLPPWNAPRSASAVDPQRCCSECGWSPKRWNPRRAGPCHQTSLNKWWRWWNGMIMKHGSRERSYYHIVFDCLWLYVWVFWVFFWEMLTGVFVFLVVRRRNCSLDL